MNHNRRVNPLMVPRTTSYIMHRVNPTPRVNIGGVDCDAFAPATRAPAALASAAAATASVPAAAFTSTLPIAAIGFTPKPKAPSNPE